MTREKAYKPVWFSATTNYIRESQQYLSNNFNVSHLSNAILVDQYAKYHFPGLVTACTISWETGSTSMDVCSFDGVINTTLVEIKERYDDYSKYPHTSLGEEDKRQRIIASANTNYSGHDAYIIFIESDGTAYQYDLLNIPEPMVINMLVPKYNGSKEKVRKDMCIYKKKWATKFKMKDYLWYRQDINLFQSFLNYAQREN